MAIFLQFFQDAVKENIDKQIIRGVICLESHMVPIKLKQSWVWWLSIRGLMPNTYKSLMNKQKQLRRKYGYQIEASITPFWWIHEAVKPDLELDIGV